MTGALQLRIDYDLASPNSALMSLVTLQGWKNNRHISTTRSQHYDIQLPFDYCYTWLPVQVVLLRYGSYMSALLALSYCFYCYHSLRPLYNRSVLVSSFEGDNFLVFLFKLSSRGFI